jgi:hypothetical protein
VPRKSPLLRFGLVALALGVLLGACKVEADITVSVKNDGSGSINIVATADADIIKEVPDLAEDLNFDDLDAGWVISGPEKTSDGGLTVSLTHEFANPAEANKLLALLNGPKGPFKDLKLTRTGKSNKSTFGLSGTVEVNGGLSAFADAKVMEIIGDPPFSASLEFAGVDVGDALDINLIASLPGELENSTGVATEDGLRSWHVTFDGNATKLQYTSVNNDVAATTSGIVRTVLIVLAGLWLIGAGVLAVLVQRAQRRRTSRQTPNS